MKRLGSLILMMALLSSVTTGQEILIDSFHSAGTRATGMGGAFIAVSNDVSGLVHNPAGLARIDRPELSSSILRSLRRNQSEFFGSQSSEELTSTRIGSAGLAFPLPVHRGSLVFGASYNRLATFDQGIRIEGYDAEVQFEKDGFSRDRGALGEFSIGGAIDVGPGVSVGLTGFRWDGDNRFDQSLTLLDSRDVHPDTVQMFQRYSSLDRYEAFGARAGMMFVHPNGGRFGLTIRPPVRVEVTSRLEDEYVDEFEDGIDVYPTESFSDTYTYTMPWELGVGFAWTQSGLTLAGDLVYVDPRETTYHRTAFSTAPNVDDFYTQYREHTRFSLGAEYAVPGNPLRVRAGYFRNPISYVGGSGLPSVEMREERQGVTFGAGAEVQKTLSFDFAVVHDQHRLKEGRRLDDVRTTRWFASVSYRFPR